LYQQGFLSVRRTCSACGGAGKVVRNPCRECRGEGFRQANRKLKVNIPAGGPMVTVCVWPVKANPAPMAVPRAISMCSSRSRSTRSLSGSRTISIAPSRSISLRPRWSGDRGPNARWEQASLRIPEGAQSGAQYRIRHKGIASGKWPHPWDIVVHLEVRTPGKLNREQRKLFEQLASDPAGG